MRKWAVWIFVLLWVLAACAPAQETSPDLEPALTAVLESKATATPPAPTEAAILASRATAPPPTETAVAAQPLADSAASVEPEKSEPLAADALLIFRRSGGFAGLDEQWVIYPDGRIELPDGAQAEVDAGQVQAIFETIQAANFFDLNVSYIPPDACCDRFSYSITVQIDGQEKTVNTIDDAPKQPEQLTTIMEAINRLLVELK